MIFDEFIRWSSLSTVADDDRDKINCESTIAASSSVDFVANSERL